MLALKYYNVLKAQKEYVMSTKKIIVGKVYTEDQEASVKLEVTEIAKIVNGEGSNEDKKARARFHLDHLRALIGAGVKAGAEALAKDAGENVNNFWLKNRLFAENAVTLAEKEGVLALEFSTTPVKFSAVGEVDNTPEMRNALGVFRNAAKRAVNGFSGVGNFKNATEPSRSEKAEAVNTLAKGLFSDLDIKLGKSDFAILQGTGFCSLGLKKDNGAVKLSVKTPKIDAVANLLKARYEETRIVLK